MRGRSRSLVCLLALACAPMAPTSASASEDPAARCASATDDDRVTPITAGLVAPAARLFDLHGDAQWTKRSTVYRCMGGAVWLCNHGANLTCDKADTRLSIPSVTAFCKQNQNVDFVPMAVTGHGVNHSWGCVQGRAVVKESEPLDARGFIASQWKRLAP